MAITIPEDRADVTPALVFKYVYMISMTLQQIRIDRQGDAPRYALNVSYRMFAVDDTGKRHYAPLVKTIVIDDYYKEAMEKVAEGDMDLANAMVAIEAAMAKIIEEKTDLGRAQVI